MGLRWRYPYHQAAVDAAYERLRDALGEEPFEAALREGADISLEEAIVVAHACGAPRYDDKRTCTLPNVGSASDIRCAGGSGADPGGTGPVAGAAWSSATSSPTNSAIDTRSPYQSVDEDHPILAVGVRCARTPASGAAGTIDGGAL